jgi:hypothetical protein
MGQYNEIMEEARRQRILDEAGEATTLGELQGLGAHHQASFERPELGQLSVAVRYLGGCRHDTTKAVIHRSLSGELWLELSKSTIEDIQDVALYRTRRILGIRTDSDMAPSYARETQLGVNHDGMAQLSGLTQGSATNLGELLELCLEDPDSARLQVWDPTGGDAQPTRARIVGRELVVMVPREIIRRVSEAALRELYDSLTQPSYAHPSAHSGAASWYWPLPKREPVSA